MFSHELKRKENMLHHTTDHVKGSQKKTTEKRPLRVGLYLARANIRLKQLRCLCNADSLLGKT